MSYKPLSETPSISSTNQAFKETPPLYRLAEPTPAKPTASERRPTLPPAQIVAAMKISVYEAFTAQTFVTLTGGVFLPAFALALGANNFYIGALAATPFLASLFQLAGAYFVERHEGRKKFCIIASSLQRLLWTPAVILFLLFAPQDKGLVLGILLGFLIFTHGLGSMSGVAWLSWMTDVVPEGIRGRYFGLRNSVISIATSVATFAGGWFLQQQEGRLSAFAILFFIASAAGGVCSILLIKQPEPAKTLMPRRERFLPLYLEPFKQPNFRRLLSFSVFWQFAFYFASPFFIVYMLTELGMSYAMTATFAMVSAIFDLAGMRVWGHISDHTGNKPVLSITATVISFLPWLWLFTGRDGYSFFLLAPLLHVAGGFFCAGYNLCSTNLLFRLAPRDRNSVYFGAWAACNGLAACAGSLLGGAFGRWAAHHSIDLAIFSWTGLKTIFLLAGALRLMAVLFLRPVKEPQGMRTLQALRVLRSVKSWALMLSDHRVFVSENGSPAGVTQEKFWPLFGRKHKCA